jgi:hypothetical protein
MVVKLSVRIALKLQPSRQKMDLIGVSQNTLGTGMGGSHTGLLMAKRASILVFTRARV